MCPPPAFLHHPRYALIYYDFCNFINFIISSAALPPRCSFVVRRGRGEGREGKGREGKMSGHAGEDGDGHAPSNAPPPHHAASEAADAPLATRPIRRFMIADPMGGN